MTEAELDVQRYMTVSQAAKRLGISRARIHQFIREGRLIAIQPGREYFIARADIDEFSTVPRPPGIQRGPQ
jgi:excisionase family DNA binding protein